MGGGLEKKETYHELEETAKNVQKGGNGC